MEVDMEGESRSDLLEGRQQSSLTPSKGQVSILIVCDYFFDRVWSGAGVCVVLGQVLPSPVPTCVL